MRNANASFWTIILQELGLGLIFFGEIFTLKYLVKYAPSVKISERFDDEKSKRKLRWGLNISNFFFFVLDQVMKMLYFFLDYYVNVFAFILDSKMQMSFFLDQNVKYVHFCFRLKNQNASFLFQINKSKYSFSSRLEDVNMSFCSRFEIINNSFLFQINESKPFLIFLLDNLFVLDDKIKINHFSFRLMNEDVSFCFRLMDEHVSIFQIIFLF